MTALVKIRTGGHGLSIRRARSREKKSFQIKSLEIRGQHSAQSLPVLDAITVDRSHPRYTPRCRRE